MLLWAPGGRGKTALVVRWLAQLPAACSRVFVPISIRAGTNLEHVFYEALAARLALLLGETPPAIADVHHTRERVQRFLASFTDPARPCLLVIDGLDEATGWTVGQALFAHATPPGLKILVSARQLLGDDGDNGWRDRLGWTDRRHAESLEILPLGKPGIADVLHRMDLAALAQDAVIVDRLFDLTSGGEPLLVELYATDLRDPAFVDRLHRPDAHTMIPGLRGFFSRWFADQPTGTDNHKLYSTLAILACAVGALRIADIAAIATHAGLQVEAPELKAVERFVIPFVRGVAVSSRTYVLTHPRLGDFLSHESELTEIYMPRVRAAFRAWGAAAVAAVNAGGQPGQVPRYLLVYYLQHLAGSPAEPLDRYRDLAENGWRIACTDHGGGEASLAEQLETCFHRLLAAARAGKTALTAPRTGLGGLVHIALCLASLRSLGTSIPPQVMAEMVRIGLLLPRRALFLSRYRRDPDRAAIIAALAPILTETDPLLLPPEARRLRDPADRASALLALAQHAPARDRMPLLSEALASVSKAVDQYVRHRSLEKCLAVAQSFGPHDEDAAFNLAEQLFGKADLPPRQTRNPSAPAPASPPEPLPARDFRTGFDPAGFILDHQWSFRSILPDLEPLYDRLSTIRSSETDDDLQDTLALIFAQDPYRRLDPLMSIASFLPDHLVSQAIELALQGESLWLGETLLPLAARLDEAALLGLFVRLLEEPLDVKTPAAIGKLLPLLSAAQIALLWPTIAALTPTYQKIRLLQQVALPPGEPQLDLLVDAAIPPGDARRMVLYYRADEIAEVRPRLSLAQLGRLLAESFASEDGTSRLLQAIAPALPEPLLTQALSQTLVRPADWARIEDLKHLLPNVAARAPAALPHLVAVIRAAADPAKRLSLLEVALPHLPQDQSRELLLEEQQEAFKIADRPVLALALASMDVFPDLADDTNFPETTKPGANFTILLAFLSLLPRIDADRAREALQRVEDRFESLDEGEQGGAALMMALCPKLSPFRGGKSVQKALSLLSDPAARIFLLFSPHLTEADAQAIAAQAIHALADESQDADDRLTLAAILAEAPHIPKKTALQALDVLETALASPATPPLTRAMLLTALQLCRRVDEADLPKLTFEDLDLPPPAADGENDFDMHDLVRFAVLPYIDGPALTARTLDLVERAAQSPRQFALILLLFIEGGWGDTLRLKPAISGGHSAQRVIGRVGGPQATTETIAAIRAVAAWWP